MSDVISPVSPQMNSLGSCSKWPSYDSLRSNCSLVHSESEHTEDEADGFSEGEVDGGAAATKSLSAHERLALSAHYLQLASLRPPPHLSSRAEQQTSQWPDPTQPVRTVSPPSASSFGPSAVTQGDVIFAQKVSVRPLIQHPYSFLEKQLPKSLPLFSSLLVSFSVQVCASSSNLCWSFCADSRLGALTKVGSRVESSFLHPDS